METRHKSRKIFRGIVSVLLLVVLLAGISPQALKAGIDAAVSLRAGGPVFDQPQPVQHNTTFEYSKEPYLRMPRTEPSDQEAMEEEYGEPVVVSEHETVYQTGEDSYATVVDTTPNTYVDEAGEEQLIDNTLAVETAEDGQEIFTNTANAMDVEMPVEMT